uniref:Uncharacterized protein n=1 Tax=Panagrolaimus superbus TaxID=310955 RepID=A0A914YGG3_9BILA
MEENSNFSGVNLNSSKRTYHEPPPSYANIETFYSQPSADAAATSIPPENNQIPQQRVVFNIAPSSQQQQQHQPETGIYPGTIVFTPGHQVSQSSPQNGPYIVRTVPVYIIPKSEVDRFQKRRKALIVVSLFFSISSIIVALIIIFGTDGS